METYARWCLLKASIGLCLNGLNHVELDLIVVVWYQRAPVLLLSRIQRLPNMTEAFLLANFSIPPCDPLLERFLKCIMSMCYQNCTSHNENDNFSKWNTKTCPLLTVCMVDIVETSLMIIRALIPSRCWCWWRVIVHLCFGFICFSQTEMYKKWYNSVLPLYSDIIHHPLLKHFILSY